jgi:hypothetical protein
LERSNQRTFPDRPEKTHQGEYILAEASIGHEVPRGRYTGSSFRTEYTKNTGTCMKMIHHDLVYGEDQEVMAQKNPRKER